MKSFISHYSLIDGNSLMLKIIGMRNEKYLVLSIEMGSQLDVYIVSIMENIALSYSLIIGR